MPVPAYAVGVARDRTNGGKQGSKASSVLRSWLRPLRNTVSASRRLIRQRGESWGFHRFYGLTACRLGGGTLLDYPWTTRPRLGACDRKTKPFSCGVVPLPAPPWHSREWPRIMEARSLPYPRPATRTPPPITGTGYPFEFKRETLLPATPNGEPSTTSRDFGEAVQDLHGRSGRLVETPKTTTPTTTLPLPRVAS